MNQAAALPSARDYLFSILERLRPAARRRVLTGEQRRALRLLALRAEGLAAHLDLIGDEPALRRAYARWVDEAVAGPLVTLREEIGGTSAARRADQALAALAGLQVHEAAAILRRAA